MNSAQVSLNCDTYVLNPLKAIDNGYVSDYNIATVFSTN